jgi:peptidyl-prolyl cis-trans isomerase C
MTARLSLALLLAAALALPASAQNSAPDAATVIARVGATEITLGHVIALREVLPPQIQAAPDERLFPAIVNQLIDQELLARSLGDALSSGDRWRLENQTRGFLSGVALAAAIDLAVTEPNIAAAYAAFAEAFGAGQPVTEWNAAHILVATEAEARAAQEAIAGGRDFGELAREISTDGAARQGGDLGWFGPGAMIPEFEEVVRNLEPGQVSDPLQTRFGWHLVRLADRRIATVPPLERVREELIEELRREAMADLIGALRAATEVSDLSAGIDPALSRRTDLLDQ